MCRAAAASKPEHEVSSFSRCLAPSMKDCEGKHIAYARASANERSSTVVETLLSVEGKVQDFVSGQFVLDDGALDISRVPPSRDVLLLRWIDAAHDGDSSAVPASDKVQAVSSSLSKKDWNNLLKRSTKLCETYTIRTRPDASKASSHDRPVTDL